MTGNRLDAKNDAEAISLRVSRRAYNPDPLRPEIVSQIDALVAEANRQGGLALALVVGRPDLFGGFLRNYGLLTGARNFIVMAGPDSDPDLPEKLGFYGERIVLELTKLGLGTCWVGGSYDKRAIGALVGPEDRHLAVLAVGSVDARQKPRERLIHSATHLKKDRTGRYFETDGTEPDWFAEAIDRVAMAPSAANRRPVYFKVEHGAIKSALRLRDDYAFVDLGIAKQHFSTARPDGVWQWGENGAFTIR